LSTHAFLLGNGQTYATRGVPYYRVSRIFMSRNFMSRIFSVPVRVLDSGAEGPGFKSQPQTVHTNYTKQRNW